MVHIWCWLWWPNFTRYLLELFSPINFLSFFGVHSTDIISKDSFRVNSLIWFWCLLAVDLDDLISHDGFFTNQFLVFIRSWFYRPNFTRWIQSEFKKPVVKHIWRWFWWPSFTRYILRLILAVKFLAFFRSWFYRIIFPRYFHSKVKKAVVKHFWRWFWRLEVTRYLLRFFSPVNFQSFFGGDFTDLILNDSFRVNLLIRL